MTENRNPTPSLPEEIVDHILSRLPVKSLLRLSSVPKSWLSLISSPQCVKSHLLNHSTILTLLNIVKFPYHFYYLETCSLYSLLNEPVFVTIELDHPMKKNPDKLGWLVGSFNGLFCVFKTTHFYLWNPSTRKSRLVPTDSYYMNWEDYMYGIGSDDFKVVKVNSRNNEVEVYSLKYDSWRRIEDFPFDELLKNYGKFVNGALHWEANTDKSFYSIESWIIVSLDMKTEMYGELLQPNYGEGKYDLTLGILNECLSVLCCHEKTRADIWIMKEYGVKESWIKLVTVPYMDGLLSYKYFRPLHISVNGDILLGIRGRILLYSSKDKKFNNHKFTNFSIYGNGDVYIESLVSPIAQNSA